MDRTLDVVSALVFLGIGIVLSVASIGYAQQAYHEQAIHLAVFFVPGFALSWVLLSLTTSALFAHLCAFTLERFAAADHAVHAHSAVLGAILAHLLVDHAIIANDEGYSYDTEIHVLRQHGTIVASPEGAQDLYRQAMRVAAAHHTRNPLLRHVLRTMPDDILHLPRLSAHQRIKASQILTANRRSLLAHP